jgi:hypothetical protein
VKTVTPSTCFATLGGAALIVSSMGCPTSRPLARCVIVASPVNPQAEVVAPQLSLAAANPVGDPVRMSGNQVLPLRCGGGLFDDPVDDLTAVLRGTGRSDGQPRAVCPAFPVGLVAESPALVERPCGVAACPNRQVRSVGHGPTTYLLFYDDPGRHRPERAAEVPSGACYYRLYALSVSWEGAAPQ